jgi:hypothetical protein
LTISNKGLLEQPKWRRPLAIGTLAAGIGMLVGAGAFTVLSVQNAARYRTTTVRNDDFLRQRDIFLYTAASTFTVSALALGTSFYLFITDRREHHTAPASPSARRTPTPRPMGIVGKKRLLLGVEGTF